MAWPQGKEASLSFPFLPVFTPFYPFFFTLTHKISIASLLDACKTKSLQVRAEEELSAKRFGRKDALELAIQYSSHIALSKSK